MPLVGQNPSGIYVRWGIKAGGEDQGRCTTYTPLFDAYPGRYHGRSFSLFQCHSKNAVRATRGQTRLHTDSVVPEFRERIVLPLLVSVTTSAHPTMANS